MIRFATIFGNAAFMGIPLIQAVCGAEAAIYASIYNITFNLFLWTMGVYLCTRVKGTDHDGDGDSDFVDELIGLCARLISDDPVFVLVNSYTTGLSASTVGYLLELHFASRFGGKVKAEEIGIPVKQTWGTLPAGASARWEK